jgi:hypothetical protein
MKRILLISTLVLFFQGCDRSKKGPEDALRSFVQYRFTVGHSRDGLLERTTGELYEHIKALEGDGLKEYMALADLKNKSLRIQTSKCEEQKCHLTFDLKYSKTGKEGQDFEIENRKIAELRLVNGDWKISDVSNVKSYIDMNKEIEVTSPGETVDPF